MITRKKPQDLYHTKLGTTTTSREKPFLKDLTAAAEARVKNQEGQGRQPTTALRRTTAVVDRGRARGTATVGAVLLAEPGLARRRLELGAEVVEPDRGWGEALVQAVIAVRSVDGLADPSEGVVDARLPQLTD